MYLRVEWSIAYVATYPLPIQRQLCYVVIILIHPIALVQSAVVISYKMPMRELKTVKDYKSLLTESMFLYALNQRLYKLSRRKDPPYFSCSATADSFVLPLNAYIITASCKENGSLEALESMLIEVARVRMHGFSERELSVVRSLMLAEIESAFLERDQMQSTSLQDEYVQVHACCVSSSTTDFFFHLMSLRVLNDCSTLISTFFEMNP